MGQEFLDCFSDNYFNARVKFKAEIEGTPARLNSHVLDAKGPDGQELSTDVVRFGSEKASKVLMMICGTHGVEGLSGSACMVDWLQQGHWRALPDNMAVVLVHCLNAYGVAWRQRQTEENIDLNRNFVAHASGNYRSNNLYDEMHDALVRAAPFTPEWGKANEELNGFRQEFGEDQFSRAILAGQYDHPDGLFFGGNGPARSHLTIAKILKKHCADARDLAIVDFHTGLGPYGHGVMGISAMPGSPAYRRAEHWYGKETITPIIGLIGQENSASDMGMGDMGSGLQQILPHITLIYGALEYGTYDVERFIEVYRANCWMQKFGRRSDALGNRIADEFEAFFYPRCDIWKEMIIWRARQVVRQAGAGLLSAA